MDDENTEMFQIFEGNVKSLEPPYEQIDNSDLIFMSELLGFAGYQKLEDREYSDLESVARCQDFTLA